MGASLPLHQLKTIWRPLYPGKALLLGYTWNKTFSIEKWAGRKL